ncbi:MAG: outer membrane beta-barrel protein [Opitutus sp.]|nr:outer membrane beta-barrel protein [Opitutus sp.]
MSSRFLRLAACFAALFATVVTASAQTEGKWTVRLRATALDPANKSDSFTALGLGFAHDAVRVNAKVIPELDISYAFTEHFSMELVLTIPQEHDVKLLGVGKLGTFKHLPPTLMAQYQFLPGKRIQPYIGAGVNFTLIHDVDLKVADVELDLDNTSLGFAGQVGADVKITDKVYFNVDVKRVLIDTAVKAGGAKLTEAKLDPWLFSVGVGYRF